MPEAATGMIKFTFRLTPELWEWLRERAFRERISQNEIIVAALEREKLAREKAGTAA